MAETFDYTSKDYASIRRDLVARIPALTDRWTDHNASDLGMVLLELLAGLGDMLAYNLDMEANECFLDTAIRRESVFALARLLGFAPQGASGALTSLRFFSDTPLESAIEIPKETVCLAETEDGEILFYTTASATLHAGQKEVQVPARQGLAASETFTGDGKPYQSFLLSHTDADLETVQVTVDGAAWTMVTLFHDSEPEDRHVWLGLDWTGKGQLRFSDGKRGAVPAAGASIEVAYYRTLGSGGNLAPGTINRLQAPIPGIQVTNIETASGGQDAQDLESIRQAAPAQLQSVWRAVTEKDVRALAEGVPGVFRAQVIDRNDCEHTPYLRVLVPIVPEGGSLPSTPLIQRVQAHLDARRSITTDIQVIPPVYIAVHIEATVTAMAGYDLPALLGSLTETLREFFALENVGFGRNIYRSDLIALLDGVAGVSHLTLEVPATNVILKSGQWPVFGQVVIRFTEERG